MPLGSFSFFILKPVSLTLSFLSNETPFLESSAEEEEELSKDFLVTSLINEKHQSLKYLTNFDHTTVILKSDNQGTKIIFATFWAQHFPLLRDP